MCHFLFGGKMIRFVGSICTISISVASLAVLLVCGCSGTKEVRAATSRSTSGSLLVNMESVTYTIKVGDAVDLSVLGYEEFKTSTTVKESGSIVVPVIGE